MLVQIPKVSKYWSPYPWYFDHLPVVFWPPIHGILTPTFHDILIPYPWYFNPLTHGILNPMPMLFWHPGQWCNKHPIHGILNPYPWHIDPLPMVCWPLYPRYFYPLPVTYQSPTHGSSARLSMVFWTLCPWYFDPLSIFCPLSILFWPTYPWYFVPLLIINEGRQHSIEVQFTIQGVGFQ